MSMPRKLRCTVAAIADHGGHVYTLDLTPQTLVPAFRPGQFLHLTVDEYDPASFWPESRVFSLASSPRDRSRIRLCYSVVGRYTRKMEQMLKPGTEVWIKLPYGEFVIDDTRDAVLLAGGTGISAFTAFIEALKPEHPRPVWLVYGARSADLLLFRDLVFAQLAVVPNLHVLYFTEAPSAEWGTQLAQLSRPAECLPGRIAVESVWARVPEPEAKVFYLSGPPVMLTALTAGLQARGVPPDCIRTDAWE